jgi:two-component system sensor histidine kinase MprB
MAIAAAVAVAVAVAAASLASYVAVRARLLGSVDASLRQQMERVLSEGARALPPPGEFRRGGRFGGPQVYSQIVTPASDLSDGSDQRRVRDRRGRADDVRLPVTARDREVAAGSAEAYFWDADIQGVSLRGITAPVATGVAVELARPVDEVQSALNGLGIILLIVTGAGVAAGAGLGWVVSGRALRPVTAFTARTEELADADDLSRRLPVVGDDEIARLARVFNGTLDKLESSAEAQRRLVADASHELRTPLASLRANIEVLQQPGDLPPGDHAELLRDVVEQTDELSALVTDIVRAGETTVREDEAQDVRLDEIAGAAIERLRRQHPGVLVLEDLAPLVVDGVPERLNRLVANLLDNAVKWNVAGEPIEVTLREGVLTVRDHGPGFPESDLPHVFERFYRSSGARGKPGSGLGLSIVHQVAQMHGASVTASNAPDGGAVLTVVFPVGSTSQTPSTRQDRPPTA